MRYPKYMILFMDKLDEQDGTLKGPLKKIRKEIDMTAMREESFSEPDDKFVYSLTAILSHKATKKRNESMYTAVVHKRVEGEKEKQWMKFNKTSMQLISESDATTKYPG